MGIFFFFFGSCYTWHLSSVTSHRNPEDNEVYMASFPSVASILIYILVGLCLSISSPFTLIKKRKRRIRDWKHAILKRWTHNTEKPFSSSSFISSRVRDDVLQSLVCMWTKESFFFSTASSCFPSHLHQPSIIARSIAFTRWRDLEKIFDGCLLNP